MASSPSLSLISVSSVNTKRLITQLNSVSLNPRPQHSAVYHHRPSNFKSSRNVISSSMSFPAQEVSTSTSSNSLLRPDELAASIFSKVMQTDRGVTLTKEEHLQVAELTGELSKYCVDSPVTCPLIFGEWDVVYCSNPTSPGGGFRSGLGRLVFKTNEMIQVVEAPDIVRNKVSFSALGFLDGEVSLKGKLIVLDEKWIKVVFESPQLKIGSLEFQFGGESEVQLEITYIDEKLRLGKGSRGSVFVFQRRKSSP
ncbi:probable plastid-lipid-associated protein 8, chloroplastic [Rutidosis leptorrhynchoides]|uniref:probable plastid-lipid-associated protein 8, chloroplastic n=1 Tax=Rutidosis leptorrhynchoides TaxID=125765 RepID=UPI003A999FFA